VLAESLPYPTLKGGDLRNWQNVSALASFAEVGVFGLCSNDVRRESSPGLPLAFWATSTDPALAYPPPAGVRLPGRAWLLEPLGHPSDLYFSDAAAGELSRLIESFRPDVVVVEGLWLHGYLDVVRAAGCSCILDCHNVEAAVLRELARARTGQDLESRVIRDVLPARTESIERNAVRAADQLWVCSRDDERRLLELYAPAAPISVIPNGIRLEDYGSQDVRDRQPCEVPLTLVFTGFFAHTPNAIAAMFLVEELFPRLASACETCRLLLVGARPSEALRAAAARDRRIEVTGAVRDIRPWLVGATAMAVPLSHGGGTRLKVLEAFAAGLPVISTAKGVEGLDVRDGTHLLVTETAGGFVEAALALWRDPALAVRLAGNARMLVAERYSWDALRPPIRHAINALMAST
jgi:polysaccharide biosynthesis protein PslH